MKRIECVIMDWAGTAVDFGCFAPVEAFIKAFDEKKISVSVEEIRKPMGKAKMEHIRDLLQTDTVGLQFLNRYKREWNEADLIEIYNSFERNLLMTLGDYATPIKGVVETVNILREQGIKIGSTTGYTRKMMDIVQPAAEKRGYVVDSCVTPDGLPAGRPAPFMIFRNMINLNVQDLDRVVKVGDTIEDIREGLQAKVHVVGVVAGSNELGLSENEIGRISEKRLYEKMNDVRIRMKEAGAHYLIDSITELPGVINCLNTK